MSDKKQSSNVSSKKKQKPGSKNQTKGGSSKPGPKIPAYLKISPQYCEWKLAAHKLSEQLVVYDLSITELGKAIAEYSAMRASFPYEKEIVSAYAVYEKHYNKWIAFRDSFRAQYDASSVPTGLAAKLLAGGDQSTDHSSSTSSSSSTTGSAASNAVTQQ
jgi:hypothetical protein